MDSTAAEKEVDFYTDPGVIDDPKSYYDRMRSAAPVIREPYYGSYMVTGYDAAVEVLTNRDDSFSSVVSVLGPLPPLPFEPEGDDINDQLDAHRDDMPWAAHLVCFDGEKHSRHRALLTSLLTYKRLKANEEYIVELTNGLIDGLIGQGGCNIVPDYAHKTSTYAISDIMGIPMEHRAKLLELLGPPPSQIDGDAVHKIGPDPLVFLKEQFESYINDRRSEPRQDLLTDLAQSQFKDGAIPDVDILARLARFLFGAGQDTTSRLIAMSIREIADDPELQKRLRETPGDIPAFVEEILRWEPPVKAVYRVARKKTTVAGVEIPAGAVLNISLTGASNDPAHFENPDELQIGRPKVRDNLAFSRGSHGCLGAPLARLEAKVAIEQLLKRTSNIAISEEQHGPVGAREYRWEPTYSFRNLADLHVIFEPA